MFANLISLIISVMMVIFLPKYMGLDEYGLWQLYLFYSSYIGFLPFGWLDGIYLRYGGFKFDNLNKIVFTSQYVAIFIFELIVTLSIVGFLYVFKLDSVVIRILLCVSLTIIPVILFALSSFILQITSRIKEYAILVILERSIFISSILIMLLFYHIDFDIIFCLDFVCKVIGMLVSLYYVKSLFGVKLDKLSNIIDESLKNIFIGIRLMISNIAGMLVLGSFRYGISSAWDIATFGKISLILNVSNFFLIFINSISVVFFPVLKTMCFDSINKLYIPLRQGLNVILIFVLALYYPICWVVNWWLPKYADVIPFLAFLFPICVFESKVILLTNTYFKSLRKETTLLKVNSIVVIFSSILTYLGAIFIHDLKYIILFILLIFVLKSFLSEYFLNKILKQSILGLFLKDCFIITSYIVLMYFLDHAFIGTVLYLVLCFSLFKNDILNLVNYLKEKRTC